jgi:hypothetical protein
MDPRENPEKNLDMGMQNNLVYSSRIGKVW